MFLAQTVFELFGSLNMYDDDVDDGGQYYSINLSGGVQLIITGVKNFMTIKRFLKIKMCRLHFEVPTNNCLFLLLKL